LETHFLRQVFEKAKHQSDHLGNVRPQFSRLHTFNLQDDKLETLHEQRPDFRLDLMGSPENNVVADALNLP
jgi:hypothetical protein